ncbi:MAG UNVERIFIED_CONTAM: hypothetical protein LVR29_00080 [Microcystis novacekii LVE1205-3]
MPALLVFSDGGIVGACLDSQRFAIARYSITNNGLYRRFLGSGNYSPR